MPWQEKVTIEKERYNKLLKYEEVVLAIQELDVNKQVTKKFLSDLTEKLVSLDSSIIGKFRDQYTQAMANQKTSK